MKDTLLKYKNSTQAKASHEYEIKLGVKVFFVSDHFLLAVFFQKNAMYVINNVVSKFTRDLSPSLWPYYALQILRKT